MKTLLFLLLPFFSIAQDVKIQIAEGITMSITRLPDSLTLRDFNLSGEWVHMNGFQKGSYPKQATSTASITFTGSKLEIFAEAYDAHKYYNVELDGNTKRIDIKNYLDVVNYLSYTADGLEDKEHNLTISGPPYGYVINYVKIYHEHKPTADTIYLQPNYFLKIDSVTYQMIKQ